jgi:putative inorganic carbon (HCO3(-)) transporter
MASMNQVERAGRVPAAQQPLFGSPVQIVGAALLSALVVGVVLAHSAQLGIALLIAVLFLPIALLNLPVAIALSVPLVFLEQWPGATRVPAGVAILLALAWFGTVGGRRTLFAEILRRHRGMYLALLALMTWITLSLLWSQDPGVGADALYVWYWAAAIVLVVPTVLSTRRHVVIVCAGFIIGALITVAISIPQLSSGSPSDYATRLGGSVINPNYFAAALLSTAALAAGLIAISRRRLHRRLLMVAFAVAAVATVATGSRGGLIAGVFMVVAAFAMMRGQRLRLGGIIAVGLILGAVWISSSDSTLSRLRDFNASGTGRTDIWTVAARMWEDHPILGVGYMNFPEQSRNYILQPGEISSQFIIDQPKETHNAYLGLLAENGIIGLALFAIVVIALMRATWQAVRRFEEADDPAYASLGRAILIAQIGALAALLFTHNTYNHTLWILLALGPVLITVAERTMPNPEPVSELAERS